MSNAHGTPVWYELMTDRPDAAQTFYAAVMGWTFKKMPGGLNRDYRVASSGSEGIAGVMNTPEHAQGMPNTWFMHVGVDDVDTSAEKVESLGGTIAIPPTDIPGVGRFAFCTDPQGAHFYLMRGNSPEASTAFAPKTPGHASWNELVSSDQNAALAFYGELFGWEHGGAMPMGDMGDYTFINHEGEMIGAMMNSMDKTAKPFWNFALQVPDIDIAKSAVELGGGKVRMGPMELPDNSAWLIQTDDALGAKIMFVGARNA